MLSKDEYYAVSDAVARHGRQYIDAVGKTVYLLVMERGVVPDTDIVLGNGIQDWEAFVTDAHGSNPKLTVQVVGYYG